MRAGGHDLPPRTFSHAHRPYTPWVPSLGWGLRGPTGRDAGSHGRVGGACPGSQNPVTPLHLGLLAQYGGAGDLLQGWLGGNVESGLRREGRRQGEAGRTDTRTDRALVLSKLINRFVRGPLCRLGAKPRGRELVDWRVGSRLPSPGLGAPAQRPALSLGVFRLGRSCGGGWLQECKDFCAFYINTTLIPMVVQAGPLGGPCVHHPRGPCAPPLLPPPSMCGEADRDFLSLSPGQATRLRPRSGPTRLEGMGGLRAQCWGGCSSPSRVSAMPRK